MYIIPLKKYEGALQLFDSKVKHAIITWDNENKNDINSKKAPLQQIYYGAPGAGKSHKIKEKIANQRAIRTTFHPDYDYAQFVGCYKPTKESEKIYSVSELKSLFSAFKALGKNYTEQRFSALYANSIKKLSSADKNSIFAGSSSSVITAEIPKALAISEEFDSIKGNGITYDFIPQVFTKAYVEAWEKLAGGESFISAPGLRTNNQTGAQGSFKKFKYTHLNGQTLSQNEEDKLLEIDNFAFPLYQSNNFGEVHAKITDVIITDKPTPDQVSRFKKKIDKKRIQDLIDKYQNDPKYSKFAPHALDALYPLLRGGDSIEMADGLLLGLYDPNTKTVYLFKENIDNVAKDFYGNIKTGDALNLLCAVYVHEMWHALYHSQNQYIPEIEEPIAECNTLRFLEKFDSTIGNFYIENVKSKKFCPFGYYGFGADLYADNSTDWATAYYDAFKHIDKNNTKVLEYIELFNPIYPFCEKDYAIQLLKEILSLNYKTNGSGAASGPVNLIIEEINRGNCAQIFGDLFQLLDRNDAGFSEYPIEADSDLQKYLQEEFSKLVFDSTIENEINSFYQKEYPNGIMQRIKDGELLLLPSNLNILATMNTSDQSLFPMDSAFKRRWDWIYVPIDYKDAEKFDIQIGDYIYNWGKVIRLLNEEIYKTLLNADKQIGNRFIKFKKENEADEQTGTRGDSVSEDIFINKVLFYLWSDVYKDCEDNSIFGKHNFEELFLEKKEAVLNDIMENIIKIKIDDKTIGENEIRRKVSEDKPKDPQTGEASESQALDEEDAKNATQQNEEEDVNDEGEDNNN